MIDYNLRIKTLLKKYENEFLLNRWTRRCDQIAALGGDIISITNYHKLEFKFVMPKEIYLREKMFSHIISLMSRNLLGIEIIFNKKKDTMTIYYSNGN